MNKAGNDPYDETSKDGRVSVSPCVCTYMWVFTWLYFQGIGSEVRLEVQGGARNLLSFPAGGCLGSNICGVRRNGELIEHEVQRWE